MKKFLITGVSGFVGQHFLDYLEKNNIKASILGLDRNPQVENDKFNNIKINFEVVDLLDEPRVKQVIGDFKPDYILHLASFSSVSYSWKFPVESFQNNTNIFLNLLEAVKELKLKTRILSIGSSEEYGNLPKEEIPIKESSRLNPVSPYAVARVSQELLSRIYADSYGLDVVMTRSFNHIGPRQKDTFVISSFAKQLVELKKKGVDKGKIITGDTSIIRDFLDVRDVVAAYYKLLTKGRKGEVYNVCSNKGISLDLIIRNMAEILDLAVTIKTDPSLIRPSDNKEIVGSNKKIINEIGWSPTISLKESLGDIIDYWSTINK